MALTKVSYSMIQGIPVNVVDLGADPTGTNDSTAAIQAALNTSVAAAVYFPQGTYKVSACLDNTNAYRRLYGETGIVGVTIESTSTDYIIDNTGSNYGIIENIDFQSDSARVGVYYNRSNTTGGEFSQYNVLRNCRVELASAPSANGGVGTVAYYNRSAELNLIESVTFIADVTAILRADTNSTFLPIYATEGSLVSMTSVEFNKCVFFSKSTNKYSVFLDEVATITFISGYFGSLATGGSPVPAIYATTMDGCSINGHFETYVQAMTVTTVCQGSDLHLYMQYPSTSGTIQLENGNTSQSSFIGNNVLIKTGGSGSANNIGVFSSMDSANVYIVSNNVNVCGGTYTPILYTSVPLNGSVNITNNETSPTVSKQNNIVEAWAYSSSITNATALTFTTPTTASLIVITAGYAVKTGVDYHTYQYTIPVWNGTPQYVGSVNLGSSGTANDITCAISGGNVITVATTGQAGAGQLVMSIKTYYR